MLKPDASLFVSPVAHEPLTSSGEANVWSAPSGANFPLVGGIPWLTPDPRRALAEWQNRSEALLAYLSEIVARLKEEMDVEDVRSLTRERIKKVRLLQIKHLEYLKDVLAQLKVKGKMSAAEASALGYRIPTNQGLLGYFPNLVRDWGPDTGENAAALGALERCLPSGTSLGRLLVPGAGGCRLAYDLHQSGRSTETICLDINPVLFLTAKRILDGFTVHLVEMPIAPLSLEATGTVRALKAPESPRPGLQLVFGDCYHLPFAAGAVDTVLTPWLIDILPRPFPELCRELNRVLKKDGLWLNTGSLNFQLRRERDNLSVDEARTVVEENGFRVEEIKQESIPYLRSELSAHGRVETLTTFRARKIVDVEGRAAVDPSPEWIRDPSLGIPRTRALEASHVMFEVQSFALSLVDGRRSIQDIAAQVSSRYGLPSDNAFEAVRNFFVRQFEEAVFKER